ncbi:EAL domain-containing protein [Lipingzhangella sp. LS1_29]|uniref:EAL domain-containing protein n=1 Tax=Lipingzhangella rawalii TaxID=2055835 RepID=A0ABU2H9L3_9ACTN|nr:EAL domain-containing protein [Lipingzhangella rawalii]MDS1272009.1 EAL domain-containing protein [Lipingzhangella rawalii]
MGTLVGVGGQPLTAMVGVWPSTVAAAVACVSLLTAARSTRYPAREALGADGVTALALLGYAALAWTVGGVITGATGLVSAGSATSVALSFGDLFILAALPLFVAGFLRLAPLPRARRPLLRHITDSYVCAVAVFTVLWLVLFAPLYAAVGEGSSAMGFALLHPVADVLVLSLLAPLVLTSPPQTRRVVLAAIGAFGILAGANLIGAITSLVGEPVAGGLEQPVRVLGFAVLAALPWLVRQDPAGSLPRITGRGLYRFAPELAAIAASALATVALTLVVLRIGGVTPLLPLVVGSAVLVLLVRMAGLLDESATLAEMVRARERHFHELARTNGDVILVVDADGSVHYLSPGAAEAYGYREEELFGQTIGTIIHPEDLDSARTVVDEVRRGRQCSASVRARVRAADGTWRHTESTVSHYAQPGEYDRLLVTTRDISAQVALEDQVNHLTFHDGITGLPNRAYLEERTRQVLRQRGSAEPSAENEGDVAVIFLDLDGFTAVNDSAGHTSGDFLLTEAARRLRGSVGVTDTVGRWGGDEFAVLVEHGGAARYVVDLANRIVRDISTEAFPVAGGEVLLSASVGVAFAEPGVDAAELLRNADMAMARAKEWDGSRVEIYASHMHDRVVRRLELQTQLRQALAEGDFLLEYQPAVDLNTSKVTAVEALVRWQRDDEVWAPERFLGAAEESGLVVPLGEWVLTEACARVAEWRRLSWDIGLSVNLSVRQILSPRFVDTVSMALADSGLPAAALTMDVDEDVLLENPGEAVARLADLRALGVRLAIDDFGMGHASLAHLRRLQVDTLKIDASFVQDVDVDSTVQLLTQSIVSLGKNLGLRVVAEGIEEQGQLERLRDMGCTQGQGFLVARPMSAEGITALIEGEAAPER